MSGKPMGRHLAPVPSAPADYLPAPLPTVGGLRLADLAALVADVFWQRHGDDLAAAVAAQLQPAASESEPDTTLLTVAAFAEAAHVHRDTVRRWVKRGRIHAFRPNRGPLRIPRSELARRNEREEDRPE